MVSAIAVVAVLGLGASAFAQSGDSVGSATTLTLPSTVTTDLVSATGASGFSEHGYWFKVPLNKGDTLRADFTPAAGVTNLRALAQLNKNYAQQVADPLGGGAMRLTLLAPVTDVYNVYVSASATGTFSVSASKITKVAYTLFGFSAPSKAKKNAKIALGVSMTPDYDGITSPIRFYIDKKKGKKFKALTWVAGAFSAGNASYSRYTGSVKLPKGTYRVRARFTDAANSAVYYPKKYKTITVK
jgi:hypothetical protein